MAHKTIISEQNNEFQPLKRQEKNAFKNVVCRSRLLQMIA